MNMDVRQPPPLLISGLRALVGHADCQLLREPYYEPAPVSAWVLDVELAIHETSRHIPQVTRWFVHVSDAYPHGPINFYPAKDGGIEATFPHQEHNTPGSEEQPWRNGRICPTSPFGASWLPAPHRDPVDDPEVRLVWHVNRTRAWLRTAVTGALLGPGDPFELPQYGVPLATGKRVVHDETPDTFVAWHEALGASRTGTLDLGYLSGMPHVLVADAFRDRTGAKIRRWRRGQGPSLEQLDNRLRGVWWLWASPIVLPPWAPPRTWGELWEAARRAKVNIEQDLRWIARESRRTKRTLCLLGFPMPQTMGGNLVEIHWQAIHLPPPLPLKKRGSAGCRNRDRAHWVQDKLSRFAENRALKYIPTENWSDERLLARGCLDEVITARRVAILGAGALGSAIARMIVQAGVRDMLLVDGDVLAAGNVCRHALSLPPVGWPKAHALQAHLATVSPHTRIEVLAESMPPGGLSVFDLLDDWDVVIDCTANDEVLTMLGACRWSIPKHFASFSLGRQGRRLFGFLSRGATFPEGAFRDSAEPWLKDEEKNSTDDREVFEGVGCWSPLAPARADDVMLAAATAVKLIEGHASTTGRIEPKLIVFEQTTHPDKLPGGFQRVASCADSRL